MHKEKLRQVKKARFMIVYAVLYCVKGDKETQSHICIYTHTHNNVWKNRQQIPSGGYLFARRSGAEQVGDDGREI